MTAKDGVDVLIAANAQRAFEALARAIGRPELIDDPRFRSPQERNRNKTPLRALMDEACLLVDSSVIVNAMHAVGSPCAVINSIDRAFAEPQVVHRGMALEMQGARPEDHARVPGDPIKLTEDMRNHYRYPPHAGEHTRELLKELLGYDDARIAALKGAVLDAPMEEKTQEF